MLQRHLVSSNRPEAGVDRTRRRALLRGVVERVAVRVPGVVAGALLLMVVVPEVALAQTETLSGILDRVRLVIAGLLVGGATVALMVAGGRHLWGSAMGDPDQIEKAKQGVKAAAIGYGIAALSVPLISLLRYVVGG